MGQYYKPVNLDKKQFVYSHDYDNGLKLMEHSWINNNFVGVVAGLLIDSWKGDRIVWAGDYADSEHGTDNNIYHLASSEFEKVNPDNEIDYKIYKFLVNHDKKKYVNLDRVPVSEIYNGSEFRIHPLPLLTCEGNGRGGGDYRKESPLIGAWARDHISLEKEKPEGYKELHFNLTE